MNKIIKGVLKINQLFPLYKEGQGVCNFNMLFLELRIIGLMLFLLSSQVGLSQILDINKPVFSEEPFFNTRFIQQNGIKLITGSRSSKKVKDIIRTKGLDYYYEFNERGFLTKQMSTYHNQVEKKDTNIIIYYYNEKNQLTTIRKSDSYGYFSNHFKYDDSNQVINQTYCRDENYCDYKADFDLAKQYTINTDSFSYEKQGELQYKKLYYNKYNKVYREEFFYFNELGYLREIYSRYIIGNKKSKVQYEYDEKGRVGKIIHFANLSTNDQESEVFLYDELDNLLEIKVYQNDKYKTSKQFLYDKKTYLLTAQLIQDIETEFIQIIQYQYTFYTGDRTSLTLDKH